MSSRRNVRFVGVLVLVAMPLAACGNSQPSSLEKSVPPAGKGTTIPSSWVADSPGRYAAHLAWTISGNNAQGNLTVTYVDSSGQKVDSGTESFTGVLSGSSLNLSVPDLGQSVSGSVSDSTLQLEYP